MKVLLCVYTSGRVYAPSASERRSSVLFTTNIFLLLLLRRRSPEERRIGVTSKVYGSQGERERKPLLALPVDWA